MTQIDQLAAVCIYRSAEAYILGVVLPENQVLRDILLSLIKLVAATIVQKTPSVGQK